MKFPPKPSFPTPPASMAPIQRKPSVPAVYRPGPASSAVPGTRPGLPRLAPVFAPNAKAAPVQAKAMSTKPGLPRRAPPFKPFSPVPGAVAAPVQRRAAPALRTPAAGLSPPRRPVIQRMEAVLPVVGVERPSIAGLTVTTTDQGLALSGTMSDGTVISGSVYTPVYYIDTGGSARTAPIREGDATLRQRWDWNKAMRVHNINANPKGQALGDYLAWYVAAKAQKAGIAYILAMHVVPKARNFYLRLGFREYNVAMAYDKLLLEKEALRVKMGIAAEDAGIDAAAKLEALGRLQETLNENMTEATLFVPVATLLVNAEANWKRKWHKNSPGNYVPA